MRSAFFWHRFPKHARAIGAAEDDSTLAIAKCAPVTENSLRFSLQLAQSFGPFTGRFGIKESTGGVGLDTLE
ncbi:MAG TPA: hypothetical protein VIK01_17650 [Polyangiaceae bacterium]